MKNLLSKIQGEKNVNLHGRVHKNSMVYLRERVPELINKYAIEPLKHNCEQIDNIPLS